MKQENSQALQDKPCAQNVHGENITLAQVIQDVQRDVHQKEQPVLSATERHVHAVESMEEHVVLDLELVEAT